MESHIIIDLVSYLQNPGTQSMTQKVSWNDYQKERFYEKYLDLNGSSDSMNEYFGYSYSKDTNTPILKVVSKTKNTCFDVAIDRKYKIVYVYLSDDGKWIVLFSNVYYLP